MTVTFYLQVKATENTAAEIRQNATALSELIASKAEADSMATLEKSRSDGLKKLYADLGITDEQQKASFDYLRTLRGHNNIRITVDFDHLILGPGTGGGSSG